MFEQERTALFRVTGVTGLVDTVGLQQCRGAGSMGIMAIGATQLAFQQGHMGPALEFCVLGLVALKAGLVDAFPSGQSARAEIRHRIVAIGAAHLVAIMDGAVPENPLPPRVAGQALTILIRQRGLAGL